MATEQAQFIGSSVTSQAVNPNCDIGSLIETSSRMTVQSQF